jgi:DUF4097 and DUF4098 domain-containing protein YvlB
MPTFDTPEPVSARLSLGFVVANVRVTAGERTDTTVEVRPADESRKADLKVAEQTQIDYTDGQLTVRAPRLGQLFGRTGSVEVTLALPAGSQLQGETGLGDVVCEGRLGECRFKTGYGEIHVEQAAAVHLSSGSGDITVDRVTGRAEISAGNGSINLGHVDGPATVKASNGSSWIREAGGDLRVNGANGGITVDRAHADVTARTANGSVRVGEVERGTVTLETAAGSLEVGIRAGTAVWLDLGTTAGRVRNELDGATSPGESEHTVEVRARTHIGDIVVRRA